MKNSIRIYFLALLILLFLGITPTAYSQSDSTPPTVTNFVIDTPTVDTTSGPDTAMFTLDVQDDLSGVRFVGLNFITPSGGNIGTGCSLDSGTNLIGTWKCSLNLPQFSEGGTYVMHPTVAISTGDLVNNNINIPKSDLDSAGFDTSFVNNATNFDNTPPTVTNFVIDTPTVDTTSGPDTAMFTLDVQDDLSGVRFVGLNFITPSGGNIGTGCSLDSGTNLIGTWKCSLNLPQFSGGGTYVMHPTVAISTGDLVNNNINIPKSDLDSAGFDTSFVNNATNFDNTPPTITNFVIDTPTVDTTSGPDTAMFTLDVQDDLSGVRFVGLNFITPSGGNIGTGCSLDSGTNLIGTWKCSLNLPQFSEGGTYVMHPTVAISTGDLVNNNINILKSDLDSAGFDTSFFNGPSDNDDDGVLNNDDNCPDDANPGQENADGDDLGDVCDTCPNDSSNDMDEDGICGDVDNCPEIANPDQTNQDGDDLGDACDICDLDPDNDVDKDGLCGDADNCPNDANPEQENADNDEFGDVCDICVNDPYNDIDEDTICGDVDNCPENANSDQTDTDIDGQGDECDICILDANNDIDEDGVCGDIDNCPVISNPDQENMDSDMQGDACDNCPLVTNIDQKNSDSDTFGDVCDNCPENTNQDQGDLDSDGIGDACERCDCTDPGAIHGVISPVLGISYIFGTSGADIICGTDAMDIIYAGAGEDCIDSGSGPDRVFSEDGHDIVDLGFGNDIAIGGRGDDDINGEDGSDFIIGGSGFDTCVGEISFCDQ